MGFTIEQVVRGYGDVCQAVTELAGRQGATLTIAEFHTLNRCLDNAIAGAVGSWYEGQNKVLTGAGGRLDLFRRKLLGIVGTATVSVDALRAGRDAGDGSTAAAFRQCLVECVPSSTTEMGGALGAALPAFRQERPMARIAGRDELGCTVKNDDASCHISRAIVLTVRAAMG